MEKSELIQKIKYWLETEQEINRLSNQLRDLRKKKRIKFRFGRCYENK